MKRSFGLLDLVLYTTAMTFSIRWLATATAAGPSSLPVWILAGLGFLVPLAIASSELSARFEGDGGIYTWTRESYGPFAGFMCGWMYWAANLPYFSGLFFFIVTVIAAAGGPSVQALFKDPVAFLALTILLTLLVTGLHLAGFGIGKWLPVFGATAACLLLALFIGTGVYLNSAHGSATDFAHATYSTPLDANAAILWSTMVFAFGGAEGIALVKSEVKGGTAAIVRAILTVGVLLVVAYIAGTTAMLMIIPSAEATRLAGIPAAIGAALTKLGYGQMAPFALGLLAVSALGTLTAWFGVAARLPFVVGVDHFLPPAFARRNARGAPVAALLVQCVIVIVLLVLAEAGATLKSAYDFLVAMSVLSYELPFLFLFAIYVKVQGQKAPAGAWTCPGGPGLARIIGVLGFVIALSAILCSLVPSPDAPDKFAAFAKVMIATAVLIAAGALVYFLNRKPAPVSAS